MTWQIASANGSGPPASPSQSSLIDFGGSGQALLFIHANGYPPACYKPLLVELAAHYHTVAMLLRPLWQSSEPREIASWNIFSEDLLQLLREQGLHRVIAVGHSVGAIASLRAALRSPESLAALILLEPVLVPRLVIFAWSLARHLGLGYQLHPLIRSARGRRRSFESLEQLFARYRPRHIFRHLSDDSLRVLVRGMTSPNSGGGYELTYSPEWEARVYYTGTWNDWDLWSELPHLSVPTLMIRGAESDTFRVSAVRYVLAANPRIKVVTVQGATHLLPLERPEAVARLVGEFLQGGSPVPTHVGPQTEQMPAAPTKA
jgi:pimeloyl-ACP methyl ester carboxylesterase